MSGVQAALVWCPFPDRESAREIATALVREKLVACANIVGQVESVFEWHGEISTADEVAVLFKTTSDQLDRVIERLGALHPYDAPAIVGWQGDAAHPKTIEWLAETLPTL